MVQVAGYLVLFATVVAGEAAFHSPLPINELRRAGLLLRGSLRAATATQTDEDEMCAKAAKAISCYDCQSLRQCFALGNGQYSFVKKEPCPSNKPYCNEGKCSATLPANPECSEQPPAISSTFRCPDSDGYFPDMASCTKYYICSNGTAYAQDCSPYANTVYDQKSTQCVLRSLEHPCFQITCSSANLLKYQVYTPAPWLYAACVDTNPAHALVGNCRPGNTINATDPNNPTCMVSCQEAGRISAAPSTSNASTDTKYYECVQLGVGRFSLPILKTCPTNTHFDKEKQRCVTDSPAAPATTAAPAAPASPATPAAPTATTDQSNTATP